MRDTNVTLHRYQLKLSGRVQGAGTGFALITLVVLLLVLHSGLVKASTALAAWHDDRVQHAGRPGLCRVL